MLGADDMPPSYLNKDKQEQFRPQLEKFYYDETKYDSYLEQLGIKYPTLKKN
jgi:aminobenzoyl-glutamate utilization protein B